MKKNQTRKNLQKKENLVNFSTPLPLELLNKASDEKIAKPTQTSATITSPNAQQSTTAYMLLQTIQSNRLSRSNSNRSSSEYSDFPRMQFAESDKSFNKIRLTLMILLLAFGLTLGFFGCGALLGFCVVTGALSVLTLNVVALQISEFICITVGALLVLTASISLSIFLKKCGSESEALPDPKPNYTEPPVLPIYGEAMQKVSNELNQSSDLSSTVSSQSQNSTQSTLSFT